MIKNILLFLRFFFRVVRNVLVDKSRTYWSVHFTLKVSKHF